jgi:hypothetical protein
VLVKILMTARLSSTSALKRSAISARAAEQPAENKILSNDNSVAPRGRCFKKQMLAFPQV